MKTILHWFFGMSVFDYTTRLECANYGGFSYLPQIKNKYIYEYVDVRFSKRLVFYGKIYIESIFSFTKEETSNKQSNLPKIPANLIKVHLIQITLWCTFDKTDIVCKRH